MWYPPIWRRSSCAQWCELLRDLQLCSNGSQQWIFRPVTVTVFTKQMLTLLTEKTEKASREYSSELQTMDYTVVIHSVILGSVFCCHVKRVFDGTSFIWNKQWFVWICQSANTQCQVKPQPHSTGPTTYLNTLSFGNLQKPSKHISKPWWRNYSEP